MRANVIRASFKRKDARDAQANSRHGKKQCPGLLTIGGYLDGTMPDKAKKEIETHLVTCATCRRIMVELYFLIRMKPLEVPRELMELLPKMVPGGAGSSHESMSARIA